MTMHKVMMVLGMAATLVMVSVQTSRAASLTWAVASGSTGDWDTTSANWTGGRTTFVNDGGDSVFWPGGSPDPVFTVQLKLSPDVDTLHVGSNPTVHFLPNEGGNSHTISGSSFRCQGTATFGSASNRWTSDLAFDSFRIEGRNVNWFVDAAGKNTWSTGAEIEVAGWSAGTFTMNIANGGTQTVVLSDNLTLNYNPDANHRATLNFLGVEQGAIELAGNLTVQTTDVRITRGGARCGDILLTGTVNLMKDNIVFQVDPWEADGATTDFDLSNATLTDGGENYSVTLQGADTLSSRRRIVLSSEADRLTVGDLTLRNAYVSVTGASASEDVFSNIRAAGGKVTFDNTSTMNIDFAQGIFHADDLVFSLGGSGVINTTVGPNATMRFGLNELTALDNDSIDINGSLTLSGVVEIVNLGGMEEGLYTLSTFAPGGFTGDLGLLNDSLILTGQIKEASLLLNGDSSALLLDVAKIPEPASALLLGLAALLALRRRR